MRARSPRAAARRASSDSSDPRAFRRRGAVGERPVEVEGVGDVELGLEPHRAGEVDVVVVDGGVAGVDVEVAVLRIGGRVDVGEVEPLDRLGDEPVQLRGTDPTGDGGDLRVHERRGLDGQGGVEWMVVSATDRARHAGTRPAWTCAHSRGSRWRSSRAWPTSFFAAVVEMPEDGAELGEAELRHQRRTLASDRLLVLTTRHGERSRVVDRLRRVQVGPPGGEDEQLGGGRGPRLPCWARIEASRSRGGEVVDLTCSAALPASRSCVRFYRRPPTTARSSD